MQEVSQATLESVDREIRSILERAEADAERALKANRKVVDAMVAHLLEHETLSGAELDAMLAKVRTGTNAFAAAPSRSGNGYRRRAVVGRSS
jgi:ATP-dependent Zn protease